MTEHREQTPEGSDDFVEVRCPCGAIHRFAPQFAGRIAKCPRLGRRFRVPPQSASTVFLEAEVPPRTTESLSGRGTEAAAPPASPSNDTSAFENHLSAGGQSSEKPLPSVGTPERMPWYIAGLAAYFFLVAAFLLLRYIPGKVATSKAPSVTAVVGLIFVGTIVAIGVGLLRRVVLARTVAVISLIPNVLVAIRYIFALGFGRGDVVSIASGFIAIALVALALFALSTKRARRFFGLRCVECGSYKVRSSFRGHNIQCLDCNPRSLWKNLPLLVIAILFLAAAVPVIIMRLWEEYKAFTGR